MILTICTFTRICTFTIAIWQYHVESSLDSRLKEKDDFDQFDNIMSSNSILFFFYSTFITFYSHSFGKVSNKLFIPVHHLNNNNNK